MLASADTLVKCNTHPSLKGRLVSDSDISGLRKYTHTWPSKRRCTHAYMVDWKVKGKIVRTLFQGMHFQGIKKSQKCPHQDLHPHNCHPNNATGQGRKMCTINRTNIHIILPTLTTIQC